ncbi:hypothetical protein Tco_0967005 [Tanacetum coccineum]
MLSPKHRNHENLKNEEDRCYDQEDIHEEKGGTHADGTYVKRQELLPLLVYAQKVFTSKGVVHFGKRGKLNPRYVGPFKVLEKIGTIAYKLELPQELSKVHNTFHVSNLKKCYSDEPLAVPLEGLHVDNKLYFVEEPVEIMDRGVKRLKQRRILIVKVNEARGAKDTLGYSFEESCIKDLETLHLGIFVMI